MSILAIALIAAAGPALAQPKATGAERAMPQAVAWQKHAVEIFNTHSAAAVAALYAADGLLVDPLSKPAKGRAAIEAAEVASFKASRRFPLRFDRHGGTRSRTVFGSLSTTRWRRRARTGRSRFTCTVSTSSGVKARIGRSP